MPGEAYPWLKIDLGRPHRVTTVWVIAGNETITNLDVRVSYNVTSNPDSTVLFTGGTRYLFKLISEVNLDVRVSFNVTSNTDSTGMFTEGTRYLLKIINEAMTNQDVIRISYNVFTEETR
jgi:hypothetical protein